MSAEVLEQKLSPLESLLLEVRRLRGGEVQRLWTMVVTGEMSRLLHAAVGREYRSRVNYDPETDVRVEYVRGVMQAVRRGEPKVDEDLEATVEFLLGEL